MTPGTDTDAIVLAEEIAAELIAVDGILAVTLGGSHARGTARRDSDIDLGILYRGSAGFDRSALIALAHRLDPRPDAMDPTPVGEWGPRINGGAWLQIGGRHVDWLYRDTEAIEGAIGRALRGEVSLEHQPGHPAGFHSQIYLAETALARPLRDPDGVVATLRARVTPYPEPLRAAILATLWEAQFAVRVGRKAADAGDTFAVAGSAFGAVATLVFVLHALNRTWLMNEKGGVAGVERLALHPERFGGRVEAAFAALSGDLDALHFALDRVTDLARETQRLVDAQE